MTTPAPPESDGPMSLLFDIWLVSGLMAGLLEDALSDSELNGDDFGMYSLMRRYGPATPTQLRRWTGLPLTTISAHLKRLEKRGHLTRSPHPDDRRSHRVGLSPAGEAAHDRATEPFLSAMHTLRAKFVPDTVRERLVLQGLDAVLRETLGLDDRPYRVELPADDLRETLQRGRIVHRRPAELQYSRRHLSIQGMDPCSIPDLRETKR